MPASVSRIPFGPSRVTALVLGDLSVPADETPWVITCTGVPTVDLPDGALALRRDGSAGSTIYERAGGAWSALGGASATAVTAASTFGTDNGLIRADGTGRGVQGSSAWTLADAGLLSGALLTVTGAFTFTGATLTGTVPIANGGTGSTTASAARMALGVNAAADNYTVGPVASDQTTTDNTTGATTTLALTVEAGYTYLVDGYLLVSTAASTNGWRCAWQLTGGATASQVHAMTVYSTTSAGEISGISGSGSWTSAGTMPTPAGGGTNTATVCRFTGVLIATAGGTATLWFRPETSGSTATLYAGSLLTVRRVVS